MPRGASQCVTVAGTVSKKDSEIYSTPIYRSVYISYEGTLASSIPDPLVIQHPACKAFMSSPLQEARQFVARQLPIHTHTVAHQTFCMISSANESTTSERSTDSVRLTFFLFVFLIGSGWTSSSGICSVAVASTVRLLVQWCLVGVLRGRTGGSGGFASTGEPSGIQRASYAGSAVQRATQLRLAALEMESVLGV